MSRHDGRRADQIRPLKIRRRYTRAAPGSVLIQWGRTTVLCTASVDASVPSWMKDQARGWLTAEYSMLPGSTSPRKPRKTDGRTTEIQRLIGRSLRAVMDFDALGPRTITVDCDVLEADGGTRTASITGALVAVVDAIHAITPRPAVFPLRDAVAAVSVGIVNGKAVADLDYVEDVDAAVDMNLVMTGAGRYVEVQGTGEESTFSDDELESLLKLGRGAVKQLVAAQKESLGKQWPFK